MKRETTTTECAKLALDDLFELKFLVWQMTSAINYQESIHRESNQKRGETEPTTSQRHNKRRLLFFGNSQFCRAVDIYNWYCRESLKLALSSNPQLVVDVIRKQTGKVAKAISKAEENGKDAAKSIGEFFQARYVGERIIRETIHRNLNVIQEPEIELLCLCRNILVHKRGYDEFGEIAKEIKKIGTKRALIGAQSYPAGHMPIATNKENYLIINEDIAAWATELLQQQVFGMDQNFAHVYKLPRKTWKLGSSWDIGL